MKMNISSNQWPLAQLLDDAAKGSLQLPDFQRGWVWDDDHIRSLLASISLSYPIGAVMTLKAGNPGVRFQARLLEGVSLEPKPEPDTLLLDGQQRLTSLFQSLLSRDPVRTRSHRKKRLRRHYYADIEACIDPTADREEDGIVGVPEDRIVRSAFGKKIKLNLTSRDREITAQMFPLDIVFDANATTHWQLEYLNSGPGKMPDRLNKWTRFQDLLVSRFVQYQVPTIALAQSTPKEAVCHVFEKVNTGGVTLTVFELLTATYAADSFQLRKDWERRQRRIRKSELLEKFDATAFLQVVTLLATFDKRQSHLGEHAEVEKAPAISCKRKDVLRLPLDDYKKWADRAEKGLLRTIPFLHTQCMFRYRDIPYTTQLVPMAAIFGWLESSANAYEPLQRLQRWFWCGVLGEMYGGGTETRFALDLEDCVTWLGGPSDAVVPRTVQDAQFHAERLLRLRMRGSAAYKGVHALQMRRGARDFRTGVPIDVHAYTEQAIDIHHVFPRRWCVKHGIPPEITNCIVNKTALSAKTNRRIGGSAPSAYLKRIETADGGIKPHLLDEILRSHDIDPAALRGDQFGHYFNQRFESLLRSIAGAMGKPVNRARDRDESPFAELGLDIEPGVRALIEAGESAEVEFKSTARFNMYSKRSDEAITWAMIKTIAAFMNSHGGTLLIGVADDGKPVGIERDYPYVNGSDRDGWELWITTAVKNALGSVVAADVPIRYCSIDGRTIARVDVHRGASPTYAKRKGMADEVFFVRLNNATEALSGSAMPEYQQKHWPLGS